MLLAMLKKEAKETLLTCCLRPCALVLCFSSRQRGASRLLGGIISRLSAECSLGGHAQGRKEQCLRMSDECSIQRCM